MTNAEFSESYWINAQRILKEAESFLKDGAWHLVVRRCQECVELVLKALLRQAGVEVPRLHDVGSLFLAHSNRFASLPLERLVSISRRLREERELSFYGDDLTETPPQQLYYKEDANSALEDARFVVANAKPILPSQ